VGDEDLLEIIGNSKNVAKLQKHFKKMFAGVSSIILNEDNSVVLGISSREGEEVVRFTIVTQKTSLLSLHTLIRRLSLFQVMFKTPVSITEHPKINEWLTLVEKEMRVTLAKLLAESVTEVEIFGKATSIDPNTYITWIDKYQVLSSSRATGWSWGHWLTFKTTLLGLLCAAPPRPSWWSCQRRSPGLRTWRRR